MEFGDLSRYKVKCTDPSHPQFLDTDWRESEPQVCPLNAAHSIDTEQTMLLETKLSNERVITDKNPDDNFSYYRVEGHSFNCPNGQNTSYVVRWPWNVQVFGFTLLPNNSNVSDFYHLRGISNLAIGILTIDSGLSDTITVSSTTMAYIRKGFRLHLHSAPLYNLDNETEVDTDSGGSQKYLNPSNQGGVISDYIDNYDIDALTVTFRSALASNVTAGTKIYPIVDRGCNVPVRGSVPIPFGGMVIGGTVTNAGIMVEAEYVNNGPNDTECTFFLETRMGNKN